MKMKARLAEKKARPHSSVSKSSEIRQPWWSKTLAQTLVVTTRRCLTIKICLSQCPLVFEYTYT